MGVFIFLLYHCCWLEQLLLGQSIWLIFCMVINLAEKVCQILTMFRCSREWTKTWVLGRLRLIDHQLKVDDANLLLTIVTDVLGPGPALYIDQDTVYKTKQMLTCTNGRLTYKFVFSKLYCRLIKLLKTICNKIEETN